MNCSKCGTALVDGARFCFHCGTEVLPVSNTSTGYNSYWSRMYGKSNYIEYKGYIYCFVPAAELTGKGLKGDDSRRYEPNQDWVLARIGIKDEKAEMIKKIRAQSGAHQECSYYFQENGEGVPFTIYDDNLYFVIDSCNENRSHTEIISIDINTKKESVRIVPLKTPDSKTEGVFKNHSGVVYIQTELTYATASAEESTSVYIRDLDEQKKKHLGESIRIVAYNEQYIYYVSKDKLYSVNLDTFEVVNLSSKLTRMQKGSLYGVDPIKDLVYIVEGYGYGDTPQKLVSINMNNKVVEELQAPKLPDDVQIRNSSIYCHVDSDSRWYDGYEQILFFNGINWVIKVNPEDVELGALAGIIAYDRMGKRIGGYMRYKEDGYISRNEMRFVLPSALVVGYKIVNVQDPAAGEAVGDWSARLFYLTENQVINSGIDFHYPRD